MGSWFPISDLLLDGVQAIEALERKEGRVNKERQRLLETLLAAGVAFGLKSLVIDRFIGDPLPEQRGFKDDVAKAVTTAVSTVLASAIVRQLARSRWGS